MEGPSDRSLLGAVTCLTALHHCLSSSMHFAPSCSVDKGSCGSGQRLDLSPLGSLPARAAGAGQGQSPGVSRSSVAWGSWWPGRAGLSSWLCWGTLGNSLSLSVSQLPHLQELEHLETRALSQESEEGLDSAFQSGCKRFGCTN